MGLTPIKPLLLVKSHFLVKKKHGATNRAGGPDAQIYVLSAQTQSEAAGTQKMSIWQCSEVRWHLFQTRIHKKEDQPGVHCGKPECGKPLIRICTGTTPHQTTNENGVTQVDVKLSRDPPRRGPFHPTVEPMLNASA